MPSAGQDLQVHGESGDNVTTLHSTGRHRLEWLPDGHVSHRDRTQAEATPRSPLTQVGRVLPDRKSLRVGVGVADQVGCMACSLDCPTFPR